MEKEKQKKKFSFSAHIVHEPTGEIFAITSDGKSISCIPKYNSSPLVLYRFYKFLVENIDPNAKIIKQEVRNSSQA